MSNAPLSNVPLQESEEQYVESSDSHYETLAYLSRYLFWLVMAVLLAVFSFVI